MSGIYDTINDIFEKTRCKIVADSVFASSTRESIIESR